jgi:hypothetical protein
VCARWVPNNLTDGGSQSASSDTPFPVFDMWCQSRIAVLLWGMTYGLIRWHQMNQIVSMMLKHISITEVIQSLAISKGDLGSCLSDPWRCVACGFPWWLWHCNLKWLLCYAGEFMAGQSSQSLGWGIRVAAFGLMLGLILPTRFVTDLYGVTEP